MDVDAMTKGKGKDKKAREMKARKRFQRVTTKSHQATSPLCAEVGEVDCVVSTTRR